MVFVGILIATASVALLTALANRRLMNPNSMVHQGAQAAAVDHLRFGVPAKRAPGRGRFKRGYARYSAYLLEIREAARKASLKDARRLLLEQRDAFSVAGGAGKTDGGSSVFGVPGSTGLPESILATVDVDGGAEWPEWAYVEVGNLGYEAPDRKRAVGLRQERLSRLMADAAISPARRWLRYESPVKEHAGALNVVHRVQASTIERLRRHATLVMTAAGSAPLPPSTPVVGFGDAAERAAAWFRLFGFYDALVVDGHGFDVVADGLVVAVVREAPGYRLTPTDLTPLLGAAHGLDRLGAMVLIAATEFDSTVVERADEQGLALFTLSLAGDMEPANRAGTALASRTGTSDRLPWPVRSGY